MSISLGYSAFKLAFQLSPIILTGGGVTDLITGGMLPIIVLTDGISFAQGILGGSTDLTLDSAFAHFEVLPGSRLIRNTLGEYPYLNQQVAANAIITQPLTVSLRMICPVKSPGSYASKLATMISLKAALDAHIQLGGTFTVATPSYFYTNCVLLDMYDITGGSVGHQVQAVWQLDFRQPLLTENQAAAAQNGLMSRLTGSLPTNGLVTSYVNNLGLPSSLVTSSFMPAASNLSGAGVAGSSVSP